VGQSRIIKQSALVYLDARPILESQDFRDHTIPSQERRAMGQAELAVVGKQRREMTEDIVKLCAKSRFAGTFEGTENAENDLVFDLLERVVELTKV